MTIVNRSGSIGTPTPIPSRSEAPTPAPSSVPGTTTTLSPTPTSGINISPTPVPELSPTPTSGIDIWTPTPAPSPTPTYAAPDASTSQYNQAGIDFDATPSPATDASNTQSWAPTPTPTATATQSGSGSRFDFSSFSTNMGQFFSALGQGDEIYSSAMSNTESTSIKPEPNIDERARESRFSEAPSTTHSRPSTDSVSRTGYIDPRDLSLTSRDATNAFVADPQRFMANNAIGLDKMLSGDQGGRQTLSTEVLNLAKEGTFTLEHDGPNRFNIRPVNSSDGEGVIKAYYIPFNSGNVDPGFADILKQPGLSDPQIVLTPGMNGCMLVVRESPDNSDYYRVYHNQHPEEGTPQTNYIMENTPGETYGELGAEQYWDGRHADSEGEYPKAVNAMTFNNDTGQWDFQSQMTSTNMMTGDLRITHPHQYMPSMSEPIQHVPAEYGQFV